MQIEAKDKKKKTYLKPRLRTIELAAEEVLSIACKTGFYDPKGIAGNGCLTGVCSQRTGS